MNSLDAAPRPQVQDRPARRSSSSRSSSRSCCSAGDRDRLRADLLLVHRDHQCRARRRGRRLACPVEPDPDPGDGRAGDEHAVPGWRERPHRHGHMQGLGAGSPLQTARLAHRAARPERATRSPSTVDEQFTFFTPLIGAIVPEPPPDDECRHAVVTDYASSSGPVNPAAVRPRSASFVVRRRPAGPSSPTRPARGRTAGPATSRAQLVMGDLVPPTETVGSGHRRQPYLHIDGTYIITLTVSNQAGYVPRAVSVTVPAVAPPVCAKPTANFTWTRAGRPTPTTNVHRRGHGELPDHGLAVDVHRSGRYAIERPEPGAADLRQQQLRIP